MKIVLIIVIIIIIYLIISYIFYLGLCWVGFNKFFKVIDKNIEKMLLPYQEMINKSRDWYDKIPKKDLWIKSDDNLKLHAILIENPKEKGTIILVHGYRSTKERDLISSIPNYYQMGYSLVLIDQRGSGLSEGKYITFGYYESRDVNNWVNYLYKNKKKNIILAGISLGATSVLLVNNKHVKAILTDSGFVNAYDEISYVIKHYFHLPSFLFIHMINFYNKLILKFDFKKVNTVDNLKNLDVPILFVHGLSDDFVPPINSEINYNSYHGIKDLYLVKDANHGMGYLLDKKNYLKKIEKILKRI